MAESFSDPALDRKYKELGQAIQTFSKSLEIDLSHFKEEIELDTIKSGQIQKFEYSVELSWKFIKAYLKIEKGVLSQGPKDVFREFGKFNFFTSDEISNFLMIIDDRNVIAHEYKDYVMNVIHPKLKVHRNLLFKILELKL